MRNVVTAESVYRYALLPEKDKPGLKRLAFAPSKKRKGKVIEMALPASAYANLASVPKIKPTVVQLKSAAGVEHASELRLKHKVEQANRVLDALEARQASLVLEIKRLQKAKAAAQYRYERLEDRVLTEMHLAGLDKVAGLHITFSSRLAAPALEVDDEALIPAEYLREKLVSSVDKVAVKSALARSIEVPGCHLTQKVSLIRKEDC